LHLSLVGFRVSDELLQIVGRQFVARDQQQRLLDHQRDRREVGRGVVERSFIERLILGEGVDAAEHELIAVGRRLGDTRDAGHAAGTADVLDDHLLAQHLRQARAENSRHGVGGAARRERHHHRDRPGRPVLRRRTVQA